MFIPRDSCTSTSVYCSVPRTAVPESSNRNGRGLSWLERELYEIPVIGYRSRHGALAVHAPRPILTIILQSSCLSLHPLAHCLQGDSVVRRRAFDSYVLVSVWKAASIRSRQKAAKGSALLRHYAKQTNQLDRIMRVAP